MELPQLSLLAVLAAAGGAAPGSIASLPRASGDWKALQDLARSALESGAADRRGGSSGSAEVQRMLAEARANPGSLGAEEHGILRDVASVQQSGSARAPVLEKLLATQQLHSEAAGELRGELKSLYLLALQRYGRRRGAASAQLWGLLIGALVLALACVGFAQHGPARLLAGWAFGLSRLWLRLLCWGAPLAAAGLHLNVWASLPREWLAAPLTGLLLGAVVLKLVDMNYPVWNAATRSCVSPILSAAAVAALQGAL